MKLFTESRFAPGCVLPAQNYSSFLRSLQGPGAPGPVYRHDDHPDSPSPRLSFIPCPTGLVDPNSWDAPHEANVPFPLQLFLFRGSPPRDPPDRLGARS